MDLATGAMGTLLPKLAELLNQEYKLQKGVKEGVRSLEKEMRTMHAALRVVGYVPRDELDELVKLWAGEVRELSYDMEDVVDKFLVHVDDDSDLAKKSSKLKRFTEKMASLFTKGKARHQIADAIEEINMQVQEVANRRGRYTVDNIVARPAPAPASISPATTIDPRLKALYTEVTELVGIAGKRDQELMKLLSDGDSVSEQKLRIVSVVGFGGLGKTTLVKTVYDKIKGDFHCRAFVPVGRNASVKKILLDIILDLGIQESHLNMLDERQLINILRENLQDKRYLIVIDDIWDEKLWADINLAFSSSNNFGSRLITTTRIASVSKFCCSSIDNPVYQMEPLSDDDSRRLFYKRIFSDESGCPHEFDEVSTNILKKCGGVPLAIITIASLLTSDQHVKPEAEWHVLLESIGRGLTEDRSVEEMLRIISYSYYDLPSHLKTCLLYLAMFPEDYKIPKDRLIWRWIAESFVQCKKENTTLFEVGETYFNELLNRSLIQPVYEDDDKHDQVDACRVHDMVLDLISSLSREDNFVTIWSYAGDSMLSQSNVRRLSLRVDGHEELQTTASLVQLRSIAVPSPDTYFDILPPLSSFVVLRVLDLTDCYVVHHNYNKLRELGSLLHLRYLSLARTGISKVPEEVGNLQFLLVLDLSDNFYIEELPSSVIKLRRLMCLLVSRDCKRLPVGLGNLTSVEVLSEIHCDCVSTMKELGNMERLRKLEIQFDKWSLELEEAFVESLGKLPNIQSLEICSAGVDVESTGLLGELWVPSQNLREFVMYEFTFCKLPAWIKRNPSYLSQLSRLDINVEEVRQEDLGFLGRLPALHTLELWSRRWSRRLDLGAEGFRCVTSFTLVSYSPGQIMFHPGAMPKVQRVRIDLSLREVKYMVTDKDGDGFDLGLGLGNLSSLRFVYVELNIYGVTDRDVEQARASLENAIRAHPNHPVFKISHDNARFSQE